MFSASFAQGLILDERKMDEIQRVYEELNRPSAAKLKIALKNQGIAFDAKDIEKLTRQDTGRQLLAPTYNYKGKIVATDINERWAADIIDYTSTLPKRVAKNTSWLRKTSSPAKFTHEPSQGMTRGQSLRLSKKSLNKQRSLQKNSTPTRAGSSLETRFKLPCET